MKISYVMAEDFCESVRDGTHATPKPTTNGYPLVTSKMLKNGYVHVEDAYLISPSDYNEINKRSKVDKWDVLFSMIGTVGETALVKDVPAYAIKNIALFKCGGNEVKGKWLYYYLNSPRAKGEFFGNQKGSSQQFIGLGQLRNLPIAVSDMESMSKIVSILSAYDDLIENHRRQIRLLEEGAERLYKEWFVKFHYPGANVIYSKENLPVGWKFNKIKDVCKQISSGGTPSRKMQSYWSDGNIKWYKTGELQDTWLINSSEHITASGLEHSTAKLFPKNSIAMAIYASPTLGRLGILSSEAACNQAMLFFIVNDELVTFEWLFFKLFELRDNFNSIAKGAGQQNISADLVKNTIICVPPIGLIRKFTYICRPFFEECLSLELQISKLQEARDRLLPKLMSGEVKV